VSGISLPVTVSAGQSVSFTVTFAPQAAGASTGSISVSSNAPESPTSIALTGTGSSSGSGAGPGPAQLGVSPSSLSFGTVTVGSSLNKGGTLSAGTSDVAVTSAAWSGQGYSVSGISFPVTVPAGKSVPFTVTFAPEAAGASTGSISFISNAANSPTAEAFSGTGAQAAQAPATPHTVDLSWTASSSAVLGYYTYRGTQSGGPYSKLNSSPSTNSSYSDSTVEAGQTYYYVVTSLGTDSVESAFSNQATAVVPSP
jgi:Abnormal spindle-like microcephaly-assoc'd, ASPM-SPD-2-Hydin